MNMGQVHDPKFKMNGRPSFAKSRSRHWMESVSICIIGLGADFPPDTFFVTS